MSDLAAPPGLQDDTESSLLGFWVFLISDAVIFALLFALYATALHATNGGPDAKALLDLKSGVSETLLLLVSSFTIGMASLNLKYRAHQPQYLLTWLMITLVVGLSFIALEVHDFMGMASLGATPQRSAFLSAFYALVATHGLHVASGCLWTILMLVQWRVFGLDHPVRTRLMCLALFWHFLDVIWVAIYTVVYLQGVM